MPYQGSMLDRVLGALSLTPTRWLSARAIADVLDAGGQMYALESAIRRGRRQGLILSRGKRMRMTFRIADDIERRIEQVDSARMGVHRANMTRARAEFMRRHSLTALPVHP